ncbi:MAG: DCC1-like thiol-disulfide oxidoreductase family protein [Deltaproteobacteria bacterium]
MTEVTMNTGTVARNPADDLPDHLILVDAACVFCSGFARFVHKRDPAGKFRFVTAQSERGRALYLAHDLDPDAMLTNIVIIRGQSFVKLQAFAAAVGELPRPWRWARVLGRLPQPFSDRLYDFIARNRYRLGRKSCAVPPPELVARLIDKSVSRPIEFALPQRICGSFKP